MNAGTALGQEKLYGSDVLREVMSSTKKSLQTVRWEPIVRTPPRLMWVEPIIKVGAHGKAYFSLMAEELMGFPGKVVFLRAGDTIAVRESLASDDPVVVHALDVSRTVSVPKSVLGPGCYRLTAIGGVFTLTAAPDAKRAKSRLTRNGRGL